MENKETMTKKEKFAYIMEVNADNELIVNFCKHEIELLNRKKTGSSKPTKTQIENEAFKKAMLETMKELDKPVTVTELTQACEAVHELSNQRVSALMTQLKRAEIVEKTVEKGKSYFSVK